MDSGGPMMLRRTAGAMGSMRRSHRDTPEMAHTGCCEESAPGLMMRL